MNKQRRTMFHASSLTSVTIVNSKETLQHANLSFKFSLFKSISIFKFLIHYIEFMILKYKLFDIIHFCCHQKNTILASDGRKPYVTDKYIVNVQQKKQGSNKKELISEF